MRGDGRSARSACTRAKRTWASASPSRSWISSPYFCLLSPVSKALLAERHAERLEERARLFVVSRGGDDGDVHPARLVHLVEIYLGEDELVAYAERVVAAPVERLRADAAEVAHARERDAHKAVEELVHALAAERDHRADGHPLAQLERRDGLLRARRDGLLARYRPKLVRASVHDLRVGDGLAEPHVDDYLLQTRNRHRVLYAELLGNRGGDLFLVTLFQSGCHLS